MTARLLHQFVSFLGVGAIATACHYIVLLFLVEGAGMGPVSASAVGAFCGAVVSYLLNRKYTFQSQAAHRRTAPRFFLVAGLALVGNVLLMALFAGIWQWPYFLAQVVTTILLILVTFGLNKLWSFG